MFQLLIHPVKVQKYLEQKKKKIDNMSLIPDGSPISVIVAKEVNIPEDGKLPATEQAFHSDTCQWLIVFLLSSTSFKQKYLPLH